MIIIGKQFLVVDDIDRRLYSLRLSEASGDM